MLTLVVSVTELAPTHVCSSLGFKSNIKYKSDLWRKSLFHPWLPPSRLCLNNKVYSVSNTKAQSIERPSSCRNMLDPLFLMCTINLPEEHHRRYVQQWEWRGRERQLRSLWTANTAVKDKTSQSRTILYPSHCQAWQIMQFLLSHNRCTCLWLAMNE